MNNKLLSECDLTELTEQRESLVKENIGVMAKDPWYFERLAEIDRCISKLTAPIIEEGSKEVTGSDDNRPKPKDCYSVSTGQGEKNCVFPACHCGLPEPRRPFTNSEWTIEREYTSLGIQIIIQGGEQVEICTMQGWNYTGDNEEKTDAEFEGNAKLIASAPEMYNFIKEMAKRYENSEWIGGAAKELLTRINTK